MATSGSGGYGTYLPSGADPFPIENTLAQIIGTNNPGAAANMLDLYQIQRQTAADNYGFELNRQHDFAKQSLAQQLYEKQLDALTKAVDKPGALDIISSSPQYQGVLGGANPQVVSGVATNLRNMQRAEQLQKGGAGISSLTDAGFQPSTDQAAIATAGLAGPQGDPVRIQVAKIAAAASAARSAHEKEQKFSSSIVVPGANVNDPPMTVSSSAPASKLFATQQFLTNLATRNKDNAAGITPLTQARTGMVPNLPMAARDTGKTTSEPPASTAAPAQPTGGFNEITTNSPAGVQAQQAARVQLEKYRKMAEPGTNPTAKAAYEDITKAMQGAAFRVVQGPQGLAIRGATHLWPLNE